jgi:hypothetical protein
MDEDANAGNEAARGTSSVAAGQSSAEAPPPSAADLRNIVADDR